MPLLRDLIDIPEAVHQSDFVLNLAEGVQNPEETVRLYVTTDQIMQAFRQALNLLKSSLPPTPKHPPKSRAAYLHGSFGCGKSHFMAVLSLLLSRHPAALARKDLLPLIGENPWLEGKKFLLVPYHMIGKPDLETAILGGYAEYVKRLHPKAGYPGIFQGENIIENAMELRSRMGDVKFFEMLNRGAAQDGDWGDLGGGWNAASLDAARQASPLSDEYLRLVGDLCDRVVTSAKGSGRYVPLDRGLAVISRHAKELGYDAVVLFLDELVLWLISRAADLNFVQEQANKLVNLVEAQEAQRPIPIVSFIARQRDLREAIGAHVPGAERLAFLDSLKWGEGRFDKISLEDRNLPLIAQERLLKPKDEKARAEIDAAFARTAKAREEVVRILLTETGDQRQFRDLYPFSPALTQTLVAVSGFLQRERTALKVLLQLLVNNRDSLELGQLVPVGDLWDVLSEGEQVFDDTMRLRMQQAKKLYREKLRPLLAVEALLPADWDGKTPLALPNYEAKRRNFQGRDRIVKTLLLAALVPEVEAVRDLDARKLVALNHGTITAPIPGQEPGMVLTSLRNWAANEGSIRLSGDQNPKVTLHLADVDTESILNPARVEDNDGNRKRKIQELLIEALSIPEAQRDQFFQTHTYRVNWRGTVREVDLVFLNVREANDENLKAAEDRWKVIIDYPFDRPPHTVRDDIARVQTFRQEHPEGTRTITWNPSFLTQTSLRDLGDLVVIDHILAEQRFRGYVSHLSPADQQMARAVLENRRSALRSLLLTDLEAAYGLHEARPGRQEEDNLRLADHFHCLQKGISVQPPASANLKDALDGLVKQALDCQYPGHPEFGMDIRPAALKRVYEYASKAIASKDGRVEVDKAHREEMASIAQPLRLGVANENIFAIGQEWRDRFHRLRAQHGTAVLTVQQLMDWMDVPAPCGLDDKIRYLVIKLFAEQTGRAVHYRGAPTSVAFDQLDPEMELPEQSLPTADEWRKIVARAQQIFGLAPRSVCNATTVLQTEEELGKFVRQDGPPAAELIKALRNACAQVDVVAAKSVRCQAAEAWSSLVASIQRAEGMAKLAALATAILPVEPSHIGATRGSAAEVTAAANGFPWRQLAKCQDLPPPHGEEAGKLARQIAEALDKQELETALKGVLDEVARATEELLMSAAHERARETTTKEAARLLEQVRTEREEARRREEETRRREEELRQREEELNRRQTEAEKPPRPSATKSESITVATRDVQKVVEQIMLIARKNPKARIEITFRVIDEE